MVEDPFDLVVVGSGIAGISAAATAVQQGMSVAVLERASEDEYGGNTRYTEANMRMKNESEVADDFELMFAENAGANLDPNVVAALSGAYRDWPPYVKSHVMTDPELVSTLAAHAPVTLGWLASLGIKFDSSPPTLLLTISAPRIRPVGGGLALIETLSAYAKQEGAQFFYHCTAISLTTDDDGAVTGVVTRAGDGRRITVRGRAVVLATGGFQGNPEMLAQYLGRRAEFIRPVAKGGYYNKGEGIRMALEIGAAPAGDFGSWHAEPTDPRSQQANAVVYLYPYGLLVNRLGKRFVDEAPGPVDNNYDHISRTIAEQPGGSVHVIYDSKIDDVPNWKRSVRSEHPPITADTLEALAGKIEVPEPTLRSTVEEYNASCVDGTFSPLEVDRLSTQGLYPPKTNWARPLDKGPFGAYPIMSANCFTFGGLKVNSQAQVLDGDGRPIDGLFAAGETMGLYHQVYTGATSVLRGAVFGRLAALTHAEHIGAGKQRTARSAAAT